MSFVDGISRLLRNANALFVHPKRDLIFIYICFYIHYNVVISHCRDKIIRFLVKIYVFISFIHEEEEGNYFRNLISI